MNNNRNYISTDNLRIEIAILQEAVYAYRPGIGKFKIPVLMTTDVNATVYSKSNIRNQRGTSLSSGGANLRDYMEIEIPPEYTRGRGKGIYNIIPKGSKFLVSFVGGNINDAKIIGWYGDSDDYLDESEVRVIYRSDMNVTLNSDSYTSVSSNTSGVVALQE